jgi:hypothetical protein
MKVIINLAAEFTSHYKYITKMLFYLAIVEASSIMIHFDIFDIQISEEMFP